MCFPLQKLWSLTGSSPSLVSASSLAPRVLGDLTSEEPSQGPKDRRLQHPEMELHWSCCRSSHSFDGKEGLRWRAAGRFSKAGILSTVGAGRHLRVTSRILARELLVKGAEQVVSWASSN